MVKRLFNVIQRVNLLDDKLWAKFNSSNDFLCVMCEYVKWIMFGNAIDISLINYTRKEADWIRFSFIYHNLTVLFGAVQMILVDQSLDPFGCHHSILIQCHPVMAMLYWTSPLFLFFSFYALNCCFLLLPRLSVSLLSFTISHTVQRNLVHCFFPKRLFFFLFEQANKYQCCLRLNFGWNLNLDKKYICCRLLGSDLCWKFKVAYVLCSHAMIIRHRFYFHPTEVDIKQHNNLLLLL